VTLEFSAGLTHRESPDPEGYISTTLDVLEDSAGISHIFVLDLRDATDKQDPRDGRTSLITAVLDKNPTLVESLLAKKVNLAIADNQQRTALLHSVIRKSDDITQILLRHHSALVRKSLSKNNTREAGVATVTRTGSYQGASSVSDMQAMLDQRDFTGKAALHHAVADIEERKDIVQSLLQAKAQVNIRDDDKNSPLHIACKYGHVDIVKSLLKYNANTGARNVELMTPLHMASQHLRIKIVTILLKENQGTMVNAEDSRGCTALHYACRRLANTENAQTREDLDLIKEGEEEVVQVLLRHGASLHNLDKNATKPLDFGKYFEEKRAEIMQAVQDVLEFRMLRAEQYVRIATSMPMQLLVWLERNPQRWQALLSKQTMQRLEYHKGRQRYQAGTGIFSSARVQEAVNEEWIRGGHRSRSVKVILLYILYIFVFTLSAVYNAGQNRPNASFLTRSVRTILTRERNGDDVGISYVDIENIDDVWDWLHGPVLDLIFSARNSSWHNGTHFVEGQDWSGYRIIGPARLSQWRTADDSCPVSHCLCLGSFGSYCFAEYCDTGQRWRPLCYGSSRDTSAYGTNLRYNFQKNAHFREIVGRFGVYGKGAFIQELPSTTNTEATETLYNLENGAWVDEATRAIALEFSMHSASARKYTYCRLLIELPGGGGLPSLGQLYATFNGFNSYSALRGGEYGLGIANEARGIDRLTLISDLLLLPVFLINVTKEMLEMRRQGRFYFSSPSNLFDLVLLACHCWIFGLYVSQDKAKAIARQNFEGGLGYVDLRPLAELEIVEQTVVATALLLVWIKFLEILPSVFEDFYLLITMIALMMGKLLRSFGPLLAIIYTAWAISRYVLMSQSESNHQSIASTMATQYPEALGEFSFDDIDDEELHQSWRYVMVMIFTVVVVIVMLNLLVSLLNDLYEELKSLAKANWCRAQATAIYMDQRWHNKHSSRGRGR
ncbi:unnamed protein product, partial [Discosporangium mesarthrocarpum]